jgi:hypothetical protein
MLPQHMVEEWKLRQARQQRPGGFVPLMGAPEHVTPEQLKMSPAEVHETAKWGI